MNWAVLRREWGAVTFVLTVVVGMIIVPLALFLANQGPGPITVPSTPTVTSPVASSAQTASPARTSPSPSPSHSP
ncbi:MAG TPA: hypothetical protein VGS16_11790 [Candidatus Dormibacteraeota bacterium]|nr:hypothetical protein [Candidatus Dormibacteraeota bacterium]